MINAFVESYYKAKDWNDHYRDLDAMIDSSNTERLLEIAYADNEYSLSLPESNYRRWNIIDHIIRSAALINGLSNVDLVFSALNLKLVYQYKSLPLNYRSYAAYVANILAFGQSSENLDKIFEKYIDFDGFFETLACLAHEMVINGKYIANGAGYKFLSTVVRGLNHPLSLLPDYLFTVEKGINRLLPRYSIRGVQNKDENYSVYECYKREHNRIESLYGAYTNGDIKSDEILRSDNWMLIQKATGIKVPNITAFDNWIYESNGKIEYGLFRSPLPIYTEKALFIDLHDLRLDCVAIDKHMPNIAIKTDIQQIYYSLFSAAACGGAYNDGSFGAYGRLYALESLYTLAGLDFRKASNNIDDLEHCSFYSFYNHSSWFYDVAWDCGFVVIQKDRQTIVVLAATDTD